jgi:SAM-dependent methyltransferase
MSQPGTAAVVSAKPSVTRVGGQRLIALTVDVEAQLARASGDPIQELIFGRFGREDFGITRMMQIADAAGHKLIFYVDLCEYWQYGEPLLDVAREVARRGHDMQIHVHADLLPRSYWADQNVPVPPALDRFPAEAARVLADSLCALSVRATGNQPLAFRGGAFRFNRHVLEAFTKNGLQLSANYYAAAKYWPHRRPHVGPFRWPNGMLELPVSTVSLDGEFRYAVFENLAVDSREALTEFLCATSDLNASLDVSSFVLHCWSLLKKDATGRFVAPDETKVERFEAFLSHLTALGYRSATTESIVEQATVAPALRIVPYDEVFAPAESAAPVVASAPAPSKPPAAERSEPPSIPAEPGSGCTVCGASRASFSEFFGRPAVRCEGCGSLERHRAFLDLCRRGFSSEWTPNGKALLLISPNSSEDRALRKVAASVSTLDVREDFRSDYHEDICNCPSLPTGAFDGVVAHHVFAHVHDDGRAFAEVARILRPDGRLFLSTPLTRTGKTEEIDDIREITRLWGVELYERYRIGTFRRYGKDDLLHRLTEWFRVIVHYPTDVTTGEVVPIFECLRRHPLAGETVTAAID